MWMGDQEDVTRDYPDNDEMSLGDAGTKSPPLLFLKLQDFSGSLPIENL